MYLEILDLPLNNIKRKKGALIIRLGCFLRTWCYISKGNSRVDLVFSSLYTYHTRPGAISPMESCELDITQAYLLESYEC